ncbi:post-GPI attachment to proteins factor 3 [Plutella xylostella]|uniref:post-GPI attachment to proteins factor 3 n=1 Tax=Plutella xylostella TaxID=51655 RepID=UPI00203232DE|nr:post-GPI attachment to proteins factor 3 [Plutella xylostella]
MKHFIALALIIASQTAIAYASTGDRSQYYQNCVKSCKTANCTNEVTFTKTAALQQDTWSRLLLWGCGDECRYHCMWKTTNLFQSRGFDVPKFHGKWPIVRILGVQEPASAFASLLNLVFHVYMNKQVRRKFRRKNVPLLGFWHMFSAVCVNAWLWSTVFHTRDTPLTEFLDYACALSMVTALLLAAVVRINHGSRLVSWAAAALLVLGYVEHVAYLYSGRVDYDYNMAVNVAVGVIGSVLWLAWSVFQYWRGRTHTWRMMCFTILAGAALSLELLDFPPKAGVWDAHALWHLATAPLVPLFYKFVIDDLRHLKTESGKKIV